MFPRLLIFMCLEVLSTKISAKKHGAEFSDFCIGSAKCCAQTISTFAFRTPSEKRSLKISTKHPINLEDGPECKYMQEHKWIFRALQIVFGMHGFALHCSLNQVSLLCTNVFLSGYTSQFVWSYMQYVPIYFMLLFHSELFSFLYDPDKFSKM